MKWMVKVFKRNNWSDFNLKDYRGQRNLRIYHSAIGHKREVAGYEYYL